MGTMKAMAGAGMGAAVMYYLDPDGGRSRRAKLRDKLVRLGHSLARAMSRQLRHAGNRSAGLAANARTALRGQRPAADDALEGRLRSRIGRVVTHPRAIHVSAENGRVTMWGHVLRSELSDLLAAVEDTNGVRHVANEVEVHDTEEGFPDLRGGAVDHEPAATAWTPGMRLLAGATGGGLAIYSLKKRDSVAVAAGLVGLGLMARASTNRELAKMVGNGGPRKVVSLQKTIHIEAPVEEVYEFWANYQNFPLFMRHIREVTEVGAKRSRWVAAGPAGTQISWDAEVTAQLPNELLAWRSLPGSAVDNAGVARFWPEETGTRIQLGISYYPPAGTVGHIVASLFGADPGQEMDDDLGRLKTLIEQGSR